MMKFNLSQNVFKNNRVSYNKFEWFVILLMLENIFVTLLANYSLYYILPNLIVISFIPTILLFLYCRFTNSFVLDKNTYRISNTYFLLFIFVYALAFLIADYSTNLTLIYYLIWSVLFISLREDLKEQIFDLFVRFFSVLLFLSIIEYIVMIFVGKCVLLGEVKRESGVTIEIDFIHTIFNVVALLKPRFQSLTEEPGLLGTLCGFLLFPTYFCVKYRRIFIIILISGLLTFSMAFYALFAIFFFTSFVSSRLNNKDVFIVLILLVIGYLQFYDYLDSWIFERYQGGEADNRYTIEFIRDFNGALNSGELFFPQGSITRYLRYTGMAGGGVWIWKYGLIAFGAVFLLYMRLLFFKFNKNINKIFIISFTIAFWISFYQRDTIYTPYTMLIVVTLPVLAKKTNFS